LSRELVPIIFSESVAVTLFWLSFSIQYLPEGQVIFSLFFAVFETIRNDIFL